MMVVDFLRQVMRLSAGLRAVPLELECGHSWRVPYADRYSRSRIDAVWCDRCSRFRRVKDFVAEKPVVKE